MKASFLASDRSYGARRIWRDLLADVVKAGLHRVERMMRLHALRARPRRRRLPSDKGDRQIANVPANLLDRQFAAEPEVDLVGDDLSGKSAAAKSRDAKCVWHGEHGF